MAFEEELSRFTDALALPSAQPSLGQMRAQAMLGWQARQAAIVPDLYQPATGGDQLSFGDDEPASAEAIIHTAVAQWYADWLLADHGYREVAWMALERAELAVLTLEHFGAEALASSTLEPDMAAYAALADAGYVPQLRDEQEDQGEAVAARPVRPVCA